MWLCVMADETETCKVDGWRKDDDKKDRQRRWESNADLGELVRCRHSLSSSPGNFAVTSCHHLVTLCPQHPVTSPLSNRACQSVVMWPGSPLTLCFFNTRYREKSWGTRGRAVVSGHACLPRSQADTNATGAVDLWQCVILCAVQNPHPPPHPLAIANRANSLDTNAIATEVPVYKYACVDVRSCTCNLHGEHMSHLLQDKHWEYFVTANKSMKHSVTHEKNTLLNLNVG